MRYRLLATYQGAPYEAGIGPDGSGVVLFAACPPPEELRFEPATGHWRKRVGREDLQALYQSLPVGMFRGERCVVLDDFTDRLHIAYLGHDAYRAERLGYWEVDRGVFELITPRQEVTEIVEQRLPITTQAGPVPLRQVRGAPAADGPTSVPVADEPPLPLEAEALRAAGLSEPSNAGSHGADVTSATPSWTPHPHVPPPSENASVHRVPMPALPGDAASAAFNGALQAGQASGAGLLPGSLPSPGEGPGPRTDPGPGTGPGFGTDPGFAERPLAAAAAAAAAVTRSLLHGQRPGPSASVAAMPVAEAPAARTDADGRTDGAADGAADGSRPAPRRRASRRRLPTQRIFSELAAQAAIPASAYAIDEDVDGAMCLVRTAEGFEVFNSLAGARHEVRVFQDEESAYFYLFGVLVADAVRTGVLVPRP
jgi:hypothetical protein